MTRRFDPELPELSADAELVVYRVAQEALTNVVRHSGAKRADLELRRSRHGVLLTVGDDGSGMDGSSEGGGITGMRERALLVGASLDVGTSASGGAEVRLHVPRGNEEVT